MYKYGKFYASILGEKSNGFYVQIAIYFVKAYFYFKVLTHILNIYAKIGGKKL